MKMIFKVTGSNWDKNIAVEDYENIEDAAIEAATRAMETVDIGDTNDLETPSFGPLMKIRPLNIPHCEDEYISFTSSILANAGKYHHSHMLRKIEKDFFNEFRQE